MISRLSNFFKDYSKLSQVASLLFFAGVFSSIYFLTALPNHLSLSPRFGSGEVTLADPVLIRLVIVVLVTFSLGITSMITTLKDKREVVVFRERKLDAEQQKEKDEANATDSNRDLEAFAKSIDNQTESDQLYQTGLNQICSELEAGQGAIYLVEEGDSGKYLFLSHGFAVEITAGNALKFDWGEGLVGQAASSDQMLYVDEVPEGYIKIISGLGSASPRFLLITPLKKENEVIGVLEIATFNAIPESLRFRVNEMCQLLADKI